MYRSAFLPFPAVLPFLLMSMKLIIFHDRNHREFSRLKKQLPVNEYSLISKHHLPVFYPMIGNDPTGKHKEIPGMKGDPKTAALWSFITRQISSNGPGGSSLSQWRKSRISPWLFSAPGSSDWPALFRKKQFKIRPDHFRCSVCASSVYKKDLTLGAVRIQLLFHSFYGLCLVVDRNDHRYFNICSQIPACMTVLKPFVLTHPLSVTSKILRRIHVLMFRCKSNIYSCI